MTMASVSLGKFKFYPPDTKTHKKSLTAIRLTPLSRLPRFNISLVHGIVSPLFFLIWVINLPENLHELNEEVDDPDEKQVGHHNVGILTKHDSIAHRVLSRPVMHDSQYVEIDA